MSATTTERLPIPNVFLCEYGRWLAVSGANNTLPKIGVFGATEEEARSRFQVSIVRWLENLVERPPSHHGVEAFVRARRICDDTG